MKNKNFYIAVILLFMFNNKAVALNNNMSMEIKEQKLFDTIKTQLSAINLANYSGLPVDTLIAHLPAGYTELKITGWHSAKLAEILYVIYPNNSTINYSICFLILITTFFDVGVLLLSATLLIGTNTLVSGK